MDEVLRERGVRRLSVIREEILRDGGAEVTAPVVKAAAVAVIANPWLGEPASASLASHAERIAPVLARALADRLLDALNGAESVEAFGKGAVVGVAGEQEHAAALIHTPYFGNLLREFLEGSSIICFADDRAGPGGSLVVPMWHKHHAATRSHYQTICVPLADAPMDGEIAVIAAASAGARPHPRIGDRSTDPEITSSILEGIIP